MKAPKKYYFTIFERKYQNETMIPISTKKALSASKNIYYPIMQQQKSITDCTSDKLRKKKICTLVVKFNYRDKISINDT